MNCTYRIEIGLPLNADKAFSDGIPHLEAIAIAPPIIKLSPNLPPESHLLLWVSVTHLLGCDRGVFLEPVR